MKLWRWLDRLTTREVVCRNCPHYREGSVVLGSARGPIAAGPGTCGKHGPSVAPRLPIDWCGHHPLYKSARKADGLYYAPGTDADKEAGFNRTPTLAEAIAMEGQRREADGLKVKRAPDGSHYVDLPAPDPPGHTRV